MRQWYAVYCRPRQEARAVENLNRQGYRVYHPKLKTLRQRKTGLSPVIESLFPRYLFILLDDQYDNWAPIRSTRGVVDLVRSAGVPLVVPEVVVDSLRGEADRCGYIDLTERDDLKAGEFLQITAGPFAGNVAEFLTRKGEDRVVVLLNIMHASQRIELPATAVSRG